MYDFYIDKILLPIAPSALTIGTGNRNRVVNLINFGEINVLRKGGLLNIRFSCLLPQLEYPFAVYADGFKAANYFLEALAALKDAKKPFQFIVSRVMPSGELLFDSNITVSLESMKTIESSEELGFDVRVDVELREYRHFGAKSVEIVEPATPAQPTASPNRERPTAGAAKAIVHEERPPQNPPSARSHTVVSGDSMWAISRRFLGNGSHWREIYNINPHIAERNMGSTRASYTIFPGQVLMLP